MHGNCASRLHALSCDGVAAQESRCGSSNRPLAASCRPRMKRQPGFCEQTISLRARLQKTSTGFGCYSGRSAITSHFVSLDLLKEEAKWLSSDFELILVIQVAAHWYSMCEDFVGGCSDWTLWSWAGFRYQYFKGIHPINLHFPAGFKGFEAAYASSDSN